MTIFAGVGHDVDSEYGLMLNYPSCSFLGADPDNALNADLFRIRLGGKFVQTAVGDPGNTTAKILTGKASIVYYRSLLAFFSAV